MSCEKREHSRASGLAPWVGRITVLAGIFVLSVLVSIGLWDYLRLPFSNPQQVAGPLASLRFNPANNQLRYAFFVLLPSAVLFLLFVLKGKGLGFFSRKPEAEASQERSTGPGSAGQQWMAALLVIFSVLVSWNTNTYLCSGRLDPFHEGESLGAATSVLHGMKPYRDFNVNHGIYEEPARTLAAFRYFGRSIGSARTMQSINKTIAFVLMALFLARALRGNVLLAFVVPILFYCFQPVDNFDPHKLLGSDHGFHPWVLAPRDMMLFGFLLLIPFWQEVIQGRDVGRLKFGAASFLFSTLPFAFFAYSIERAVFITLSFGVIWICLYSFFLRTHPYRLLFLGLSGLGAAIGIAIFHVAIDGQWRGFFTFASFTFSKAVELQMSYVFEIQDPKNMAILLVLAANLYWLTHRFLRTLACQQNQWGPAIQTFLQHYLLESALLILSLVYFRSATSRCDWSHVAYVSNPGWILSFLILAKHYLHPWLQQSSPGSRMVHRSFAVFVLFLSVLLTVRFMDRGGLDEQFPWRHKDYEYFVKEERQAFLFFKNTLKPDDGFFTMTAELVWYYLLDKPYPVFMPDVFFAVTRQNQQRMIEDLEGKNIPYIMLTSANCLDFDGLRLKDRIPLVWEYVLRHYEYDRAIGSIVIYRRRGAADPVARP